MDALSKKRTHTILSAMNETSFMTILCQAQDQAGNTALEDINQDAVITVTITKQTNSLGSWVVDGPDTNGRLAWSQQYTKVMTKAEFQAKPGCTEDSENWECTEPGIQTGILMYRPFTGDYGITLTADNPVEGTVLAASQNVLTAEVQPGATYVPKCEVASLVFGRELCTGNLEEVQHYTVYTSENGTETEGERLWDDLALADEAERLNATFQHQSRQNPATCWNIVNPKTRFEIRIKTVDIAGNYRGIGGDVVQASFTRTREWCLQWRDAEGSLGAFWGAHPDGDVCEAIDFNRVSEAVCMCDGEINNDGECNLVSDNRWDDVGEQCIMPVSKIVQPSPVDVADGTFTADWAMDIDWALSKDPVVDYMGEYVLDLAIQDVLTVRHYLSLSFIAVSPSFAAFHRGSAAGRVRADDWQSFLRRGAGHIMRRRLAAGPVRVCLLVPARISEGGHRRRRQDVPLRAVP